MIRKYTLANAVEHEGIAQAKSILGRLLSEHPEMRTDIHAVRSAVETAIRDVNRLGLAKQKKELENLGGYTAERRVEKKGLPELDIGREKFTVRFAPNPDGALHLGNARPALLSDAYAKKYHGRFILRFDDTDPKIKVPEKRFYSWIREDLKWLKIKVSKEVIASKRLRLYYKAAEKLVSMGHAYVCTCSQADWKKLRDNGKACSCRSNSTKTNMILWRKMVQHKFREGEAVLRIKTDLAAKNQAVRDWPAFRIVDKPNHPLQKAKLWPLYNFASAIDDHMLAITHIFRGQEHSTNEIKQRYLYSHMKWTYPEVIILGRFSMADMALSKSQIREGIVTRKYRGWDDSRLGTLRTLRRRGFQPEAIRQIVLDIGPKPSDVTIAFENLAAYNRKSIDFSANRYFFVPNPKRIVVAGMKVKQATVPLHPDDKKRGIRKFSVTPVIFVDTKDFDMYKGVEVRLKDLCNIKLGEKSEYTGTELKPTPKIQWIPATHVTVKVLMPGREITGYGESNILNAKAGQVVQFERFGFVRIEKISRKQVVAVFSHE